MESRLSGSSALPLEIKEGCLLAAQTCVLSGLPDLVYASSATGLPGIVLGLKSASSQGSSFENVALGFLKCHRYVTLLPRAVRERRPRGEAGFEYERT